MSTINENVPSLERRVHVEQRDPWARRARWMIGLLALVALITFARPALNAWQPVINDFEHMVHSRHLTQGDVPGTRLTQARRVDYEIMAMPTLKSLVDLMYQILQAATTVLLLLLGVVSIGRGAWLERRKDRVPSNSRVQQLLRECHWTALIAFGTVVALLSGLVVGTLWFYQSHLYLDLGFGALHPASADQAVRLHLAELSHDQNVRTIWITRVLSVVVWFSLLGAVFQFRPSRSTSRMSGGLGPWPSGPSGGLLSNAGEVPAGRDDKRGRDPGQRRDTALMSDPSPVRWWTDLSLSAWRNERMDLVPRSQVRQLHNTYLQLLARTADAAWEVGVGQTINVLNDVLSHDHEVAAAEAPRGIAHNPTGRRGRDDDWRGGYNEALEAVADRLGELGLVDLLQRSHGELSPLEVETGASSEVLKDMRRSARFFLLQAHGVGEDEIRRRVDDD